MIVKEAVTRFKESKTSRIKSIISPKEKTPAKGKKLKNKFREKVSSKKRGIKNAKSSKRVAEVRLWGYGIFNKT